MSMSDMFADMLKKAIPAEVMELLTPEKIKAFGEQANAFVTNLQNSLERIEQNQAKLEDTIAQLLGDIQDLKEANNDNNRGNKRSTKRSGNGSDAGSVSTDQ